MNALNEALDGLGRWYVAIPPVLIVTFLAALFFLTGAGQARLQQAVERSQRCAERERAIEELQVSLSAAVAAQRGFLLTADRKYRDLYDKRSAEIEPRLERLRSAYDAADVNVAEVRSLQLLIGKRLADLSMGLSLQDKAGSTAAVALLETSVGTDAGAAIGDTLDALRDRESIEHADAARQWHRAMTWSRWITLIGTLLNLILVGVASRLIYADIRRRNSLAEDLRGEKSRLEREVEERTAELVELSTHLQSVAEREKASLARELHDELGGLLVGARMDISWAEQRLPADDAGLRQRLQRVQENLAAGVDLKRRIIEELRPTLLDNVGLFAALRWQLKETCRNAGMRCIESYPDEEPKFTPLAAIALFRIAQEAFNNIVKHAGASTVDLSMGIDEDMVLLRIADDGRGMPPGRFGATSSHGLASMRHRVRALGGRLDIRSPDTGGTTLLVRIPAARAISGAD